MTVTFGQWVFVNVLFLVIGAAGATAICVALFASFARDRRRQATTRAADWRKRAGSTGE